MLNAQLVEKVYHSYLIVDAPEGGMKEDFFEIHILENNEIHMLAPFQLRTTDERIQYYYDVTGMMSLERMSGNQLTDVLMMGILDAIVKALESMYDYLMDENNIVLEADFIFLSPDKKKILFIYLPGRHLKICDQLKNLGEFFMKSMDYGSQQSVVFAYGFYNWVCKEGITIKDLQYFVKEAHKKAGEDELAAKVGDDPSEDRYGAQSFYDNKLYKEDAVPMCEAQTQSGVTMDDFDRYNEAQAGNSAASGFVGWDWVAKVSGIILGIAVISGLLIIYFWGAAYMIPVLCIVLIACLLIVIVNALRIYKRRDKEKDEFWKSDDYIDYENMKGDLFRSEENSAQTTLLQKQNPDILLKSLVRENCEDLHIHKFPAIIGKDVRDPCCCIPVSTVSRRHARIDLYGREYRLTDLNSSNGTYINGEMIKPHQPMMLKEGDSIIFSDTEFIFEKAEETQ